MGICQANKHSPDPQQDENSVSDVNQVHEDGEIENRSWNPNEYKVNDDNENANNNDVFPPYNGENDYAFNDNSYNNNNIEIVNQFAAQQIQSDESDGSLHENIQSNENNMNYSNVLDYTLVQSWLSSEVCLPQYFEAFITNGYESMDRIYSIKSKQELTRIGIILRGHQTKIMADIHRAAHDRQAFEEQIINNDNAQFGVTPDDSTVKSWLNTIVCLPQYYDNFLNNGYDTVEQISTIISRDELDRIGIILEGHQQKIMSEIRKLLERNHLIEEKIDKHEVDAVQNELFRDHHSKWISMDEKAGWMESCGLPTAIKRLPPMILNENEFIVIQIDVEPMIYRYDGCTDTFSQFTVYPEYFPVDNVHAAAIDKTAQILYIMFDDYLVIYNIISEQWEQHKISRVDTKSIGRDPVSMAMNQQFHIVSQDDDKYHFVWDNKQKELQRYSLPQIRIHALMYSNINKELMMIATEYEHQSSLPFDYLYTYTHESHTFLKMGSLNIRIPSGNNVSYCLLTNDERSILIFMTKEDYYNVYIIDIENATIRKSDIGFESDIFKTYDGVMVKNDVNDENIIGGFVRSCWISIGLEYIRFPSNDVISIIRSYYSVGYLHIIHCEQFRDGLVHKKISMNQIFCSDDDPKLPSILY